ncbi:MAG TPA: cytochrome c [Vicinamibacterales bacterium]|jgi:mono/diheme cytochrome c family protein
MPLVPSGTSAIRIVAFLCTCASVVAFTLIGHAGQQRSVTEGVYSAAQATRGQQAYKTQCAECHGAALEGSSGPPLVGELFLSNWSGRSLVDLVDKIQKTMPFNNLAGSLSREQSIDLTAYILQGGKFPAAQVELAVGTLAQTTFPASRPSQPAAAAVTSRTSLPPPEGNLAELMRAIAFPNSNVIFNLQIKDPGAQAKKKEPTSFDYVEWGSTVYTGWQAVDQAAIAITETAPLFLTPGRRCQNGKPVPVDRADWQKFTADLVEAGKLAHRASQARDFKAFVEISDKLNDACANCHKVYRDKGGAEGSGAARCE